MPIKDRIADTFFDRCFTSYAHEGLFLSDELMREMGVREGEIIKLISEDGTALVRIKHKNKWNIAFETEKGLPFNVSFLQKVKKDPEYVVLGALSSNKLAYESGKHTRYISLTRYERKPECEKARSIVVTVKEEVEDVKCLKTHWKEDFSVLTEIGDIVPLFSSTIIDLEERFALDQIKDLTRVPSIGPSTQAFLKAAKIRNYNQLLRSSMKELEKIRRIGAKRAYDILLSASNCIGLPGKVFHGRVTETLPSYAPVLINEETEITFKRPFYARLSVKGYPNLSMQCLPALKEIYSLDTVKEDALTLKDKEERLITLLERWQIEFEGFDLEAAKKELEFVRDEISYGLEADVEILFGPSRKPFDIDQFSSSLDRIIKVTAMPMDDITWLLEEEQVIPDTNVLVDNRLCSIILRELEEATFGYELPKYKITIPKIVLFEMKRMADDKFDKFRKNLGERGLNEVGKLRALADAGIIQLEFSGEPPQYELPNVLRDEFILEEAKTKNATLLTGDERLARSAYTREIHYYYLRSINDIIIDKTTKGPYTLKDACKDLMVGQDLVLSKAEELERRGILKIIKEDQNILFYKLRKKIVIIPDNTVFIESPSISEFLITLKKSINKQKKELLSSLRISPKITTNEVLVEVEIPNALSDLWRYQRRELKETKPYEERKKLKSLIKEKLLRMEYARGVKERPNLEELERGEISHYLLSSMSRNKIFLTNDETLTEEAAIRGFKFINLKKRGWD